MRAFVVVAWMGLMCLGCAGQPVQWVPRLVVRGAIVHHADADLRGDHRAWDWEVQAGVAWPLSRVARPASTRRSRLRSSRTPPACLRDVICVWERRERARAYEAALRRLEEEP